MSALAQSALRIGEEYQRQYGESGDINIADWSSAIQDAMGFTLLEDQIKELRRSYMTRQGKLVYKNDLNMDKWRAIWAAGFTDDPS